MTLNYVSITRDISTAAKIIVHVQYVIVGHSEESATIYYYMYVITTSKLQC